METIGQYSMWSFLENTLSAERTENTPVRKGRGHFVRTYIELVTKVAELQFRNREWVMLFRGQRNDYHNREQNTALKPSLFRPERNTTANPDEGVLNRRFHVLAHAEEVLVKRYLEYGLLGQERLQRQRILRWAILQHYEVCDTPLLDVTQSLRIAASFASLNADDTEAFVFVLGVPNLSGAVTASSEAGLQTVRLSSACPPSAVRPHIQEGYLLGEYPEMGGYDQKQFYPYYEIDFGRRLLAKFRFNPRYFWDADAFPPVTENALYPNANDPLYRLALAVKKEVNPD